MREWTRVSLSARCGRCGKHLDDGAPLVLIQLNDGKVTLKRCEDCEGPAPPDLPRSVKLSAQPARVFTSLGAINTPEWTPYKDTE